MKYRYIYCTAPELCHVPLLPGVDPLLLLLLPLPQHLPLPPPLLPEVTLPPLQPLLQVLHHPVQVVPQAHYLVGAQLSLHHVQGRQCCQLAEITAV